MKANVKWKKLILPYMVTLLFVLLPVLAFLQYQWIGELSEREKENIKLNLEYSTTQYSFMFSREIVKLQENFVPDDSIMNNKDLQVFIKNRVVNWRNQDMSGLLDLVYLINLENETECYKFTQNSKSDIINENISFENEFQNEVLKYLKSYNSDYPNQLIGKFEYVVLPILKPEFEKSVIVLKLNAHYIIENIIKNNFNLYFKGYNYLKPIIAIKSKNNELIYSNDTAYVKNARTNWYDINMPIGMLPPVKNKMFQHRNHEDTNRKHLKPFVFRNRDRIFDKLPEMFQPSMFYFGFRSGNLDSSIQSFRIRNLVISFSILLLLSLIIIIIIKVSIKAKKLGNQQLQFVSGITHELRTPITVIRTASQNLADGIVTDNPKSKLYGNLILKESDKLWDMIETTLMFAGIESNRKLLKFDNLSLITVIEKAISNCRISAREKNIDINFSTIDNLPEISGDENALITAFQNIVLNAIKFNTENGKLNIEIHYITDEKNILATFIDNGTGISKKDLPHIFEPFYRGEEALAANVHGNGIGLSIVKNIFDLHHVKIRVESSLNHGTKFSVYFQVAK